jgi:hypothetical protein
MGPPRPSRRAWLAGGAVLLAWILAVVALEQPRPLFLNLGVGDTPFARGFRSGWERDGLTGSGETTFHWTEDGARLELPLEVRSGTLRARFRLARFSDSPATLSLYANDRLVDHWVQKPQAWGIRSIDLGAPRGSLALQFRSESKDGLGVALDWVEITGARQIVTLPRVTGPVVLLALGLPLLAWAGLGRRVALYFALGLPLVLALGLRFDRLGALVAVARGALPVLVVAALVVLAARLLAGLWPEADTSRPGRAVPLGVAVLAVLALQHPFFYYPDVDTHARFVTALRAQPWLAIDATEYQLRTGTWATRLIGEKRVLFPYSAAFHVLTVPVAAVLGDVPTAVKTAGATAFGVFLLLVYAASRAAGLEPRTAIVAQLFAALLPVEASRLSLALYPGLLGQACDLLLVTFLLLRYKQLGSARGALAAVAFLVLAQAAYTGSIFNVAGLVGFFVLFELVGGDRRLALRLLGAYATAAILVVLVQYARFIPVLLRDVLPHAQGGVASARPMNPLRAAGARFLQFHGPALSLLVLVGAASLRRVEPYVRRLLAAVVATGATLLVLRYEAPTVFKDAKELELLAAPLAILAAAGFVRLWHGRGLARVLAVVAAAGFLAFVSAGLAALYAARFVAIGR